MGEVRGPSADVARGNLRHGSSPKYDIAIIYANSIIIIVGFGRSPRAGMLRAGLSGADLSAGGCACRREFEQGKL